VPLLVVVFREGGGGAGGPVTVRVAVAVVSPAVPVAVRRYVVVLAGVWRLVPLAGTVPKP
jgi:hypothetical protein